MCLSRKEFIPHDSQEGDPLPDSMINKCAFSIKADYFAKLVDTEIPSVKKLECNSCDRTDMFTIFVCDNTIAAFCIHCNTMIIIQE